MVGTETPARERLHVVEGHAGPGPSLDLQERSKLWRLVGCCDLTARQVLGLQTWDRQTRFVGTKEGIWAAPGSDLDNSGNNEFFY